MAIISTKSMPYSHDKQNIQAELREHRTLTAGLQNTHHEQRLSGE